jgi:hypothetical protein
MIGRSNYFDYSGRPIDPRIREIQDFLAKVRNARLQVGYTVPLQYSERAVAEWAEMILATEGFSKLPVRDGAGRLEADLVSAALVYLLSPYMPFGPMSGIEKMIISEALEVAFQRLRRKESVRWAVGIGGVAAAFVYLVSRN